MLLVIAIAHGVLLAMLSAFSVGFKEGCCLSDPSCLLDSSVSVNWLTDNSQVVCSVRVDLRLPAVSGRSQTSAQGGFYVVMSLSNCGNMIPELRLFIEMVR